MTAAWQSLSDNPTSVSLVLPLVDDPSQAVSFYSCHFPAMVGEFGLGLWDWLLLKPSLSLSQAVFFKQVRASWAAPLGCGSHGPAVFRALTILCWSILFIWWHWGIHLILSGSCGNRGASHAAQWEGRRPSEVDLLVTGSLPCLWWIRGRYWSFSPCWAGVWEDTDVPGHLCHWLEEQKDIWSRLQIKSVGGCKLCVS